MTTEQLSLWNRIEQFSLDEANASLPFSRRLARENRWTHARALRAIAEYKRFMFLGCVAGHPVSPSEDVDQVWHLHLAYSKSYWKDFCGDVLRQPFHHEPTKGGRDESAKFEDWYGKTRASYRTFFGAEPPADVWPPCPVHHELKWVDVGSNWVIPKPRWAVFACALGSVALVFTAGCSAIGIPNIFDLRGPDFLGFFFWFALVMFIGAFVLRRILISGVRAGPLDRDGLDAYDLAFLAGRQKRATDAAIVALMKRHLIAVTDSGNVQLLQQPEALGLHPVELSLVDNLAVNKSLHLHTFRIQAGSVLAGIQEKLEGQSLIFKPSQARLTQMLPLFAALAVPMMGLIKIMVGISRDKPVMFLVLGSIATLVGAIALFARVPFRTGAGEALLKKMRLENRTLRTRCNAAGAPDFALPMAVALFGMAPLAGTPYAPVRKQLAPAGGDSGSFWSTSGSSCGGSSGCGGGGSGCGGGGGCGGCGSS